MATFGEIIYMVLDILKEHSDDAYYTEEHVIFLASKMRALLLERKYKGSKNSVYNPVSEENMQTVCLDLEPDEKMEGMCAGQWLRSVQEVPELLNVSEPKLITLNDLMHSMLTFIPAERMPYVGYNKWLKNIIYASRSRDGHLYLSSGNPQFMYLEKTQLSGVFADPEEAAKLSCEAEEDGCDILKMQFPLEQALIPSCIELIVQELTGSRYAPEDKKNDAKDDLGEISVTPQRQAKPVERSGGAPKAEVAE